LASLGVGFAEAENHGTRGYDLGREGGHSQRRVLHVGDATGRAVETALLARVMAEPNIMVV
jgi:L-aspartate oxidase